MNERRWLAIGALVAVLFALASALTSRALTRPAYELFSRVSDSHKSATLPTIVPAESQSQINAGVSAASGDGYQSNVLEIPKASLDFVGEWGGSIHSTIHSSGPNVLTGKNPDRISIIFGRQGETVFIADEVYSWPHQRIVGTPRVRTVNPKEVVIEYESQDAELYYVYTNRFALRDFGKIDYRERIDVYDRATQESVGTVDQRSTLRRLLTADEQRRFAHPSAYEVPRSAITALTDLAPGTFDESGLSLSGNRAQRGRIAPAARTSAGDRHP